MYTKKFLLPMDYGANDENTLKIGVRLPSLMKLALEMPKRIHHLTAMGLGPAKSKLQSL